MVSAPGVTSGGAIAYASTPTTPARRAGGVNRGHRSGSAARSSTTTAAIRFAPAWAAASTSTVGPSPSSNWTRPSSPISGSVGALVISPQSASCTVKHRVGGPGDVAHHGCGQPGQHPFVIVAVRASGPRQDLAGGSGHRRVQQPGHRLGLHHAHRPQTL